MDAHRAYVELLPPVGAVGVTDHTEILQDPQGAIDGRWRRLRVLGTASLDELAPGDVTVGRLEDLQDQAPLGRPAHPEAPEVVAHLGPGRRSG